MLQNHSSKTLFTFCIHECLVNIYTKFYLPSVPKLNIKIRTTIVTILIIFVYAFNSKLYLPSTFKTADIELLSPKIET